MHHMARRWGRGLGAASTAVLMAVTAGCSLAPTPPTSPPTTSTVGTATATIPPSPVPLGKRSRLAWDSGVVHNQAALTSEFEKLRGVPLDVIGVAPTRDSWDQLLNAWWLSDMAIPQGFDGTLNVALPLFPDDGSMQAAAAGQYDAQWEKMGALIAERYPTAYVRVGWEMNIVNWRWHVTPDTVEDYKSAYRHAVEAMRKSGPELRFVFNPNEGKGNSLPDATLAYPGDDVVDIIGIDAYDWSPPYDAAGWRRHLEQPGGWDFWARFARSHGKRFAVPEWGVIPGSKSSGGDNPFYIRAVMEWMASNADVMAFETYFDEREAYCSCSLTQNPKAKGAYLEQLDAWKKAHQGTGR